MIMLRMTGRQHSRLRKHLCTGDGLEALALALCGRAESNGDELLLVHRLELVPHAECRRSAQAVSWEPTVWKTLIAEAARKDMAIAKFHSHPGGYSEFSSADDESDRRFFESVFGWSDSDRPHASVVMLPEGEFFGRAVQPDGAFAELDRIAVAGDEVRFWSSRTGGTVPDFAARHAQLFGKGTTAMLAELRVGVVGCSGTGSPLVEQLARLGVGELVLVDADHVEEKNLNRIVGATRADAAARAPKVDVAARRVEEMGLGTTVRRLPVWLGDGHVGIRELAGCDFVFGCMDSACGRDILNRLARHYLVPYIDVGVKLVAGPAGAIDEVGGVVHYLTPDGEGLLERGVFTPEELRSEALMRDDPKAYAEQHQRGYVQGVAVDRPAVVSVNTLFAALAANEFLARLHPYRVEGNRPYAAQRLSLSHGVWGPAADREAPQHLLRQIGRGETVPLLGMPALGTVAVT